MATPGGVGRGAGGIGGGVGAGPKPMSPPSVQNAIKPLPLSQPGGARQLMQSGGLSGGLASPAGVQGMMQQGGIAPMIAGAAPQSRPATPGRPGASVAPLLPGGPTGGFLNALRGGGQPSSGMGNPLLQLFGSGPAGRLAGSLFGRQQSQPAGQLAGAGRVLRPTPPQAAVRAAGAAAGPVAQRPPMPAATPASNLAQLLSPQSVAPDSTPSQPSVSLDPMVGAQMPPGLARLLGSQEDMAQAAPTLQTHRPEDFRQAAQQYFHGRLNGHISP